MLPPSALLDPSVSHQTVIDEIRKSWRRVNHGEFILSLGLRRIRRDQAHRGAGFGRIQDYAEFVFGIPPKLASLFSEIGRHLERLPRTRTAMERGEITYTKAREFVRFATTEDEADWISFAKHHTNRELERAVARARAEKAGVPYEDTKTVKSTLNGRQKQAARKAREMLAKEEGKPVPESELLPKLLEKVAEGTLFGKDGGSGEGEKPKPSGPYLAIHLCPACLHSWVPTPRENMEVTPDQWIEEMRRGGDVTNLLPDLLCDCEDEIHRRDECPHPLPRKVGPAKSRHLPAEVKRRIEARDGFRCRVPGCGSPVAMQGGHMEQRYSEGAPNDAANVGTQCAAHNRQIETGALFVKGRAPFEKYYLRDGTFLGWGFDPEVFEQRIHHMVDQEERLDAARKGGKRAPPAPVGGVKSPV